MMTCTTVWHQQFFGLASNFMSENYYVYLYRNPTNLKVMYVGYGTEANRAHASGHNERVLPEAGKFIIEISEPYRDEVEARNVEAALIYSLKPEWNKIEGTGNKFRPFGVPIELISRRTLSPITLGEIGKITGGALIVLSSEKAEMKTNVDKLSPTNFEDNVIIENIREYWHVAKYKELWATRPATSPRALVGVQGPTNNGRIVVASIEIDQSGWNETPQAPHKTNMPLHRIPLVENSSLDLGEIRGRLVDDAKFQVGSLTYIWVDGYGQVRHGTPELKNKYPVIRDF